MAINGKIKKKPYLPIDGSEDPHPLLIPLQNFQFRHDTYSSETDRKDELQSDFIGRDNLVNQLGKLLSNTERKRGSYLIAGYRGSGKTCLINRVINKYKEGRKKVIFAKINLGHDGVLDTRHVLFNIISVLNHEFKVSHEKIPRILPLLFSVPLLIFCCFILLQFIDPPKNSIHKLACEAEQAFLISDLHHNKTIRVILENFPIQIRNYLNNCINVNKSNNSIYFWEFLFIIISLVILMASRVSRNLLSRIFYFFEFGSNKENTISLNKKIQDLHDKVAYSFEKDVGTLGRRSAGIGFLHKTKIPEMKEPQIEL